jgi:polyhydroxybutyrate depolymerase
MRRALLLVALAALGGAAFLRVAESAARDRIAPEARIQGTFTFAGRDRRYTLHIPQAYAGAPAALTIVLHGGGSTDDPVQWIRSLTRFDAKADAEANLVLYPEAIEHYWNDGRGLRRYTSHVERVDDVGFIVSLVDHVAKTTPIDLRRVYVTGASNGGMMAFRLACERPERFAAVAVVAANLPVALGCAPAARVPVLIMNGTADPAMPWQGGEVRFGLQRLGEVRSALATAAHWARVNGCDLNPAVVMLPDRAPRDGTRVARADFQNCPPDGAVVLYRVDDGGHTWPGGPQQTPARIVGPTSRDIDATDVIVDFFRGRARSSQPSSGVSAASAGAIPRQPGAPAPFGNAQRIDIRGYSGNAMEPAISKDGQTLVFNDYNPPASDKNLFWARRVNDTTFEFMGALDELNSPQVEASPGFDAGGRLYFTSLRDYPRQWATLYRGSFASGRLTNVERLDGDLYRRETTWAALDPDVTPDGRVLYFVEGRFGKSGPQAMDLRIAIWRNGRYELDPAWPVVLKSINTDQHLEYAPAISSDNLELFFTRILKTASGQATGIHIYRSMRTHVADPFSAPEVVGAATGFVEAPSLTSDGRVMYFHRRDADRFYVYRVVR